MFLQLLSIKSKPHAVCALSRTPSDTMLCTCYGSSEPSDWSLYCGWQQSQRQMQVCLFCTGSHGSHLSPADVCGLLSQCHVPWFPDVFQHQETISPKWLPAFSLLFVSEYTHLFLYSYLPGASTLTTGGQMKIKVYVIWCHLVRSGFLADSISLALWCLCPWSYVQFKNIEKLCVTCAQCYCCLLVHKTQTYKPNLAYMAASSALSTPMILNSHSHNNACDQPEHFTAIKPPWHPRFIIHFALSHCSQKDLHVALVLVCQEALWHQAWCTFHGSHSCQTWKEEARGEDPSAQMWAIWFAADTRCSE